jgi:hypothetical protein
MRRFLLIALFIPIAAHAEVVGVKGFGDVELSGFDCTAIAESKLLHRVCYDEAHRYLLSQIGDEYNESCNISSKLVDGLMDSDHVVAYYNQQIRPRHKCTSEVRARTGVAALSRPTQ